MEIGFNLPSFLLSVFIYLLCGFLYAKQAKIRAAKHDIEVPKYYGLILLFIWLPYEFYETLIAKQEGSKKYVSEDFKQL